MYIFCTKKREEMHFSLIFVLHPPFYAPSSLSG